MSLQDKNGVEKNNYNPTHNFGSTSDSRPMVGRRTVKKLIKPIQHLKRLDEPRVLHAPSPSVSPQLPPKRPNLGSPSPVTNSDLPEKVMDAKEEPFEAAEEATVEAKCEDLSGRDERLMEPSSSLQPVVNWTDYKGSVDACSPGKGVVGSGGCGEPFSNTKSLQLWTSVFEKVRGSCYVFTCNKMTPFSILF